MTADTLLYIERLGSLALLALVLWGLYGFVTGRVVVILDAIAARLTVIDGRQAGSDVRLTNIESQQRKEDEDHARILRRLDRIADATDAERTGVGPAPRPSR